jgi:KaiC/GvpD/RAD55 family RecA-like ATPase
LQHISSGIWYKAHRGRVRESTIYDKLKKGPAFKEAMEDVIPRGSLVDRIRLLTIPAGKSRLYTFIIGEHGTGKTSLITLAVNGMDEPKGVVYVDAPRKCDSEVNIVKAIQTSLGWSPDPIIDSNEGSYSSSILVNVNITED